MMARQPTFLDKAVVSTVLLTIASLVISLIIGLAPTDSYTWSKWTVRYYGATAAECKAARRVANRYAGPVVYYPQGRSACVFRVRSRYAVIDNWGAGWRDRIVQLENSAAVWPAWGMTLTVKVHWNGKVVRHEGASLLCRNWGIIVRTTEKECKVMGSGTSELTARMSYDASFVWTDFGFNVRRGAQERVSAVGGIGMVQKWP